MVLPGSWTTVDIYPLFLQSAEKKAVPHFWGSSTNVNKSSFSPSWLMTCLCCVCISFLSLRMFLRVPFLCTWEACYLCLNIQLQVGLLCINQSLIKPCNAASVAPSSQSATVLISTALIAALLTPYTFRIALALVPRIWCYEVDVESSQHARSTLF